MKRRRRGQIEPAMASHFPSLSRNRDVNSNVHMFTQDVQLAVMPIGGKSKNPEEFSVTFEGNQNDQEKAEQLIGSLCRYDRYDLSETVSDAIDEIATNLAHAGCAAYEIISGEDKVQQLWGFTSKRLWRFPGRFLQIIPRGDWGHWGKKFVIIPAGRIWFIEMPTALGGRRGYKSILNRLRSVAHLGPDFWRKDLERGVQTRSLDFQLYVRNSEIYFNKVTKDWGWNRRDWSQKNCTEFYAFYKLLKFTKAKVLLREHIVSELNKLLKRLNIKCEIMISGLPTIEDVRQVNSEMFEGSISFSEASDRVRF